MPTAPIEDELKKIVRRIDTIQKSVDTLNNDRNLLEDILGRLSAVEQALHLNVSHQTAVSKDIKADIREAKFATEDKVEKMIDDHSVIVTSKNKGFLTKIKKIFDKEVK